VNQSSLLVTGCQSGAFAVLRASHNYLRDFEAIGVMATDLRIRPSAA
jgi:hypothetical protein